MSKPDDIEILQSAVNAPVVRIRGRAFPGIIVQGDTLNSLYTRVCAIVKRDIREGREDTDAEFIRDTLEALLEVYETVLDAHGVDLPYATSVKSRNQDQRP